MTYGLLSFTYLAALLGYAIWQVVKNRSDFASVRPRSIMALFGLVTLLYVAVVTEWFTVGLFRIGVVFSP